MPEPTSTPEPDTTPSPLGIDPQDDVTPAPDPRPVDPSPNNEPEPPKPVTLSPDEHAALLQKAGAFDTIQNDPHLAGYVGDHFRKLAAGGNPAPVRQSDEPDEASLESFDEFRALKKESEQTRQLLQRTVAELGAERLLRKHPDATKYEKEIVHLVNEKGLNLEDAYDLAKARAASAEPPQPRPAGDPAPTAEGKGPGAPQDVDQKDILEAASDKIDDPSRRVRIGDAFDMAVDAATKFHNQEQ